LHDSTVEAPRGVQVYAINDVINEIHGNPADESAPVKLSRLVGVGKVPAEELQRTYKNGVSIDIEMESSMPQVTLPSPENIDVEASKE